MVRRQGPPSSAIAGPPAASVNVVAIECDALVAWPCEPAIRNEDASQDWPRRPVDSGEPAPADGLLGALLGLRLLLPRPHRRSRLGHHDERLLLAAAAPRHRDVHRLPAPLGRRARADGRAAGRPWPHRSPAVQPRRRAGLHRARQGAAQPAAPHLHAAYVASERRRLGVEPLTTRQRQILQYVAAGMGNRQIARRLGLSDATIRKHLENIFARLQVTSRTAAVKRADLTG